jgi:hypothetical protein
MIYSLDEAIKHCEEKAEELERSAKLHQRPDKDIKGSGKRYLSCLECAKEHRQLADWLKELKAYREAKERIRRGLQSCFNMVHCESNHDILEGQERAFKYCIEQLEVNADEI